MEISKHHRMNLKILLVLSFGHLVTDIYQGSLPAILPFVKARLDLSFTLAGVILMAANFTSSLLQPLLGYLSDKKEKAILLPLGCLAAGVGLTLLPLAPGFGTVLLLVVVSGLGVAAYHPEGYKTAAFFTGQRKATGMSVFSVGGNLGFALGPILALSVITYFSFGHLPVLLAFAFLAAALLWHNWSALHPAKPPDLGPERPAPTASPKAYLALSLVIAVVVMRSWTQMGLMAYIPFYYIDYLKGDALYAGKLVSVFLLGGAAGTILGSMMADRLGYRLFLRGSLLAASLVLPLILVVRGPWLFAVLALAGLALISSFTVTIVMAQRLLPQNLGIASGLMVGFAIGTGGLGVTILGAVADRFGVPAALHTTLFLPLVGLGLSLLVGYPDSPPAAMSRNLTE
jgi:FSR family fosmidomycin resistance protein-like MFS transporter